MPKFQTKGFAGMTGIGKFDKKKETSRIDFGLWGYCGSGYEQW